MRDPGNEVGYSVVGVTGTWTKYVFRFIAAFTPTRAVYLFFGFFFGREVFHRF